jgi:hypothetical protein
MQQIYAYPLLRLLEDDSAPEVSIQEGMDSSRRLMDIQQVHKILTSFRELWNTRDTLNFDLRGDELDGCRFGLEAMQDLLNQPGCDGFSKLNSVEINHKIFIAMKSPDAAKLMAEFMRWATDCYMDFLVSHTRFSQNTAKLGLLKIDKVKNRLLVNMSEVDRFIQLNNLERDNNSRFTTMLEILTHLFNAIVNHHRNVLDSRVGIQEILLVAEEHDFIQRRTNNHKTLHNLFATNDSYGLPMGLSLEGITLAITKQIKQRCHHMPLEYAIMTVVPVIPRLDRATLKLLPLPTWSTWFKAIGIEQIGDKLAADVVAQLAIQTIPATPSTPVAPSVYNTAPTHISSSVASIATNLIQEELEDAFNGDRSVGSHNSSLFGSRHSTPQNAPIPPPKDTVKPPFKLALPPTPLDQKILRQGITAPQAADTATTDMFRTLPESAVPHTHTISESGWPESKIAGIAGGLRLPIQRSRAPLDFEVSRRTPSIADNGSEYTSGSTPAARHGTGISTIYFGADVNLKYEKPNYDMAGSNERAAETIERLRQAKPMQKSGKKNKMLSPMAPIEEEQPVARKPGVRRGS